MPNFQVTPSQKQQALSLCSLLIQCEGAQGFLYDFKENFPKEYHLLINTTINAEVKKGALLDARVSGRKRPGVENDPAPKRGPSGDPGDKRGARRTLAKPAGLGVTLAIDRKDILIPDDISG